MSLTNDTTPRHRVDLATADGVLDCYVFEPAGAGHGRRRFSTWTRSASARIST